MNAIESGNAWIKKWVEFTDALEQSQLSASHWVEVNTLNQTINIFFFGE